MKKLIRWEIAAMITVLAGGLGFALWLMADTENMEVPAQIAAATTAPAVTHSPETTAGETTEAKPAWMTFPDSRKLTAKQYFVYDLDQKTFTEKSGEMTERVYPASVTKLFTAYVAMTYLAPQTEITVGDVLDLVVWGSSVAELQKGDVLTADTLVEAMLLPSGNDAAYVLAAEAGKKIAGRDLKPADGVAVFVKKMNEKAAALGMTGTHFANPDGIHDENHYTTFGDLAILGEMAVKDPTVLKNAGTAQDRITLASGEKLWKNTNALVDKTSPYYCPHALGLKTGQTPSAGSCLLSAFRWEEKHYLIGVFGCPEEEDRFMDTLQLFNKAIGLA